jgi:hypothetical protein
VNATVDTVAADLIHVDGRTSRGIAPGQQLKIPFRFKVQDGVVGSLQIAVQYGGSEPVVFTGSP